MALEGTNDLISVVTLLGAAVIAVPLFKRIGLGAVLGYLTAGLVIGPFGLGLFEDPQAIIHTAELGVVMFLFVIGLEMKPAHLWHLRNQIFGLGAIQVLVSATLLTTIGIAFGFNWEIAFVSSAGFVLTSTAIVMQVLGERHELSMPHGQKMVSILLFEDLLIVPLLAIVTFLSPTEQIITDPTPIWQKISIAGLALFALIGVGFYLLNPFFKMLANAKAREVMTAAALLVVLGAALLMEMGGLSMAMGAFVAGVLLSESSFRHQLEVDIEPFRGLLLGLFFLGVGMTLDLKLVIQNWRLILSALFIMMIVKSCCIYLVARSLKSSHAEAIDRAVLMSQGGEFAFVLFSAASAHGVISATIHANMTAVVVLSMVLTPITIMLLKFCSRKGVISLEGIDSLEHNDHQLHGNVLIVGFGRMGQIASQAPIAYGADITIIDNNPTAIRAAKKYGFNIYYGDGTRSDILRIAGAHKADCVMICVDDPTACLQIVENVRQLCPNVKIIARAVDRQHEIALVKSEADYHIRETFEAAIQMGNKTLKVLGANGDEIEEIATEIRRADKERFELEVAGNEFAGRDLLLKNIPKGHHSY